MPFIKRGQEPHERTERTEPPIITDEMRIGWYIKDAERFSGKKLSEDEKLNLAICLLRHKRG